MRWKRLWRGRVAHLICFALCFATSATAYETFLEEGHGERYLGSPIDQAGTRWSPSSPPVKLQVNLLRVDDANNDGKAEASSELPEADRIRFSRLVNDAARFWDQVPTANFRVELGGTARSSTFVKLRSTILVTLGTLPARTLGASWHNSYGAQHQPMGIIINIENFRAVADAQVLVTIVHEIGHSLGMHHSSCDRNLTRNQRFSNTDSEGAFMSYGRKVQSVLHTDDVAGFTHLYPSASAATEFGAIEGDLREANGNSIFGGNVFVVDQNNRATVSRLSGMSHFVNEKSRDGRFRLEGLRPGTYTLVAAPVDDPTYRIGHLPELPKEDLHQRRFKPAVVTGVVIRAGETVSVGRVVEGTQRALTNGKSTFTWDAVAGASDYFIYLLDPKTRTWAVMREWVKTNEIAIDIPDGFYQAWVYARVRYRWKTVMRAKLVGVGSVTPKPPILNMPAQVNLLTSQRLSLQVAAGDPQGSRIRLSLKSAPPGMLLHGRQLYWGRAIPGTYPVQITATNEFDLSTSVTLKIVVSGPLRHSLSVSWTPREGDENYKISIYCFDQRRVIHSQVQQDTSLRLDLVEGNYYIRVLRFTRTQRYQRMQRIQGPQRRRRSVGRWQWLGYKLVRFKGDTIVQLP